ncbi:MAG: hypothetical protein ABIQ18_04225 [Umezawaea sp.]
MRFNHQDTWMISLDSSSDLDLALYVRDALNITTQAAGSIPPLDPAVPASDLPAPPGVERLWDEWWTSITDLRLAPGKDKLAPIELPAAWEEEIHRLRLEYSRWAADLRAAEARSGQPHTREVIPFLELVDHVRLELGRDNLDFMLSIQEIPVAGRYWQRVNTDTVMASSALLRSEEGATKLRAVILELAARG